jgi:4-carboxymuconolactone decarboxylase
MKVDGEPVRVLRPGDTVWIPPGAKHWHGATPDSAMTHVAVSESQPGSEVRWLEPVTEAQYRAP